MASPIARRRLGSTLLATLMCLAGSTPCAAEWRRIDSPNFTVIGDVGASTLREVAVKFEGFRETLGRVMNEVATISAVPTVVIVFPSDRAFRPFKTLYQGRPVEISGLFIGTEDTNYIAVIADGRPEAMRVVFHEYAHLIVSNVWRNAPMWISEGFAEFYSTYEVSHDGDALIGRPISEHVQQLKDSQLLKLPELLGADRDSPLYNEQNRRSIFYAQSWALSHLIMHGKSALLRGQPPRRKELVDYMDAVTQGMQPVQAWQRAFGTFDVEAELKKYIRSDSFGYTKTRITDKLAAFNGVPELLPLADAEAFLAEFLMQQDRHDEAIARLDAAEKLDPGNPRVSVTRTRVEIAKRSEESAAKRLLSVSNTNDWLLAYSAGVAMVEVVERRREAPTVEQLAFVRLVFDTVVKHRGDIPNVNARLAFLELRSPSGPSTNARASIERARMRAPGREDYALIHAQILAYQQEYGLARHILGPLMSAAYPEDVRHAARELMRYLGQLESREHGTGVQTPSGGVAANPRGQLTDAPATPSSPQESSSSPIFRELKDGEQRLEGVLERIECRARGAATFHIRTDTGLETVTTPRMTSVEFISYRTDLSGTVTCGPLKSPLPVIATWRFDPVGKEPKTAVALEFPPQ